MTRTKEITNFIIGELEKMGNDDAMSHSVLITDLLAAYPALGDRIIAANRINQVLRNKQVSDKFKKIKGGDKKHYIIRNQQVIRTEVPCETKIHDN